MDCACTAAPEDAAPFNELALTCLAAGELTVAETALRDALGKDWARHYGGSAAPDQIGITAGCKDIYYYNIDCQWIDVTELPLGTYTFKMAINPEYKV